MNLGSALGSAAQLAGGVFGSGYKNPANAAMPYLNQIPGTMKPYYDPYIQAGQQSLGDLMSQYGQLMNDPGQKFAQMGQGFQQSPGYQFQYNQGMNAANSAAGAGGMAGTPYHQQNAASMASNLANQDFYNYMGNVQGLYGQGLQGASGINQMGYNASNELAQSLAAALMNQGGMAYAGQNNQNMANSQRMGNIFGGAAGLGMSMMNPSKDFFMPTQSFF